MRKTKAYCYTLILTATTQKTKNKKQNKMKPQHPTKHKTAGVPSTTGLLSSVTNSPSRQRQDVIQPLTQSHSLLPTCKLDKSDGSTNWQLKKDRHPFGNVFQEA
ncbi:hypothetical protein L1049_022506 [Liquidambar formosana]|uniref:Uncharacterized protein n=1 Tax=Liquidambar formosana TaxID=63359 RepID=A0AAP0WP44_LIQFO